MKKKKALIIAVVAAIFIIAIGIGFYLLFRSLKGEVDRLSDQEELEPPPQMGFGPENIYVERIDSDYKVASGQTSGSFKTGQEADLMLSGVDFNDTGGPLMFNHPGHIATDGTHLLLADRNNNRVLIWNSLPTENTPPDLVLGQENFDSNDPGKGVDGLDWPVSVATDGKHVFVADTYNHRILIWNNLPTNNKQSADIVLESDSKNGQPLDVGGTIRWPWDVWTDGKRLVVASTGAAQVLIWNEIPTSNNQEADLYLRIDDFGTPRTIGSDGTRLVIGDHNAFGDKRGDFFWKSFPTTSKQPYDFFISAPTQIGKGEDQEQISMGDHMASYFAPEGEFFLLGNFGLAVWNKFLEDEEDSPDLILGAGRPGEDGYRIENGDGSGLAYAGGKLYLSLSNGNKVVVYNGIPTDEAKNPDFAIGSEDINTNTLDTNYFISNPVPATNGESLFVSSDFDGKLYVWKNIPDESGAKPDLIYHNVYGWDNDLYEDTFVLGGKDTVYLWESLPLEENLPDIIYSQSIGDVEFREIEGVAIDEKYFYVADRQENKVYIWDGIPKQDSKLKYALDISNPGHISSNGKYLAVTTGHNIQIYEVDSLSSDAQAVGSVGGIGLFNLPQEGAIIDDYLFVADTCNSRIIVWEDVEKAIAGSDADIILGAEDIDEKIPEIGKDKLFWPAAVAFDGSYLWVGEFKFSGRVLRYSPTD